MKQVLNTVALGLAFIVSSSTGLAAEPVPGPASKPATSRPASEIVLVRVGKTEITQEDFNRAAWGMPLSRVEFSKPTLVRGLIGQRLLMLYLDEHPELVDEAEVQKRVADILEAEGVKTREELEAKMKAQGTPGKLEHFIYRTRMLLGREEIVRRTKKYTEDDEYLKKRFEEEKRFFDGTRMFVREILIRTLPWDTPEQIQAKRAKAERIREDLVAGRRTWEQCLTESDSRTKITGGDVGYVPRHLEQPEAMAAAAFELKPGETSEVLEDRTGFYIIQVTKKVDGDLTFERAKTHLKLWLEWEPLQQIDAEMRAKHEVVGIREPDMPPPPASMPATQAAKKPVAATRPAAVRNRPGARPATPSRATQRPTARPATPSRATTRPTAPPPVKAPANRPAAAPKQ